MRAIPPAVEISNARRTDNIIITNAGWFSNTTKERLSALPGVHISQKKGEWYLNDELWDGKPTVIERATK